MIDIHSHIIYEVDDGASSISESLRMMEQANKLWIKAIVATPHFHRNIFEPDRIQEHFDKLSKLALEFNITLLLGYEVFISPLISELLEGRKNLTIDDSRYLLMEFPCNSIPPYSVDTVYKMQLLGITPIIAHPERNRRFLANSGILLDFIERGCLIQIDAASILGVYGINVKGFAKRLIQRRMAHFVASDAHYAKDYQNWYGKAYEKVCRWSSEEYADLLFYRNAEEVLESSKKCAVYKL